MSDEPKLIVGLGELLWDLLPGGKQLGGAPANFTVMSARLGNRGVIASSLGRDALGDEARAYLAPLPADLSRLQMDQDHATGSVSVTLHDGQAEYVFRRPVAWDFLACTPVWRALAQSADAVCFGTLAQRHEVSREAIRSFLAATREDCVRVFDVNLRKPFYDGRMIGDSLQQATLLKMNEIEMPIVMSLLGLAENSGSDEAALLQSARLLLERFPLKLVCVTMGSQGSLLAAREAHHRHHGIATVVADTVGAGDAFTAALVCFYLRGAPLAVLNEAGNRWGSWVASQRGAMPALSAEMREAIEAQILQATVQ
ncbi:PfkB family carbohydrate kinase [Alloacidobacterium sp.]|uniref:PfkB family carbohydrate kinase n=1 Tax=Alloacidobacterium sp. TaxID=2951999 RepID=UPI002D40FB74|nr:PfkB family carbohydrate kinase [Alloacidobacterium sp.]HYK37740.1 PfkB family carbohydrate kinase [Alloacidobacterium sp.]